MRTHTSNFKNQLVAFGREFEDRIKYNNTVISNENVMSD